MRLYQMRDKIIYGTVRQYHIWFIRSIGPFPFPLDNPPLIEYSFSDRTRETLVKSLSLMGSMLPL